MKSYSFMVVAYSRGEGVKRVNYPPKILKVGENQLFSFNYANFSSDY